MSRSFQFRAAYAAVSEFLGQGFRAAGGAGLFVRAPDELAAPALRGAFAQHAIARWAFFDEGGHAFERLPRCVMNGQPIARGADGLMPAEILPEVDLFFCEARALRKFIYEFLCESVHHFVEFCEINAVTVRAFLRFGDLLGRGVINEFAILFD